MSDPVASKSTFLCMYMTNHLDTLVAYVKHFGKVTGNVSIAEMKSIDCKGMNLSYSLKNGGVRSVRVNFDPPLSGYDDVKPRLLAMKADAQEALGMLKSPKITSFRLPASAGITALALLTGTYLVLAPSQGTAVPFIPADIADMIFTPAHAIWGVMGFRLSLRGFLQIVGSFHALESVYTWYLCRRYVKGPLATMAYMSSTFIFGVPIFIDLKRRVQQKRIESVMKAE